MATITVRIDAEHHRMLRELSARTGESLQAVLAQAVEQYRRRLFLEQVNEAYAALNEDPAARAQWEQELREWDATLGDGLD
jgi:hypothetical protein